MRHKIYIRQNKTNILIRDIHYKNEVSIILIFFFSCEREYIEIRDGGTDSSRFMGRYCKDIAPSSMSTTGNMMYVYFYTDLPEPKNGFKAVIVSGGKCVSTLLKK